MSSKASVAIGSRGRAPFRHDVNAARQANRSVTPPRYRDAPASSSLSVKPDSPTRSAIAARLAKLNGRDHSRSPSPIHHQKTPMSPTRAAIAARLAKLDKEDHSRSPSPKHHMKSKNSGPMSPTRAAIAARLAKLNGDDDEDDDVRVISPKKSPVVHVNMSHPSILIVNSANLEKCCRSCKCCRLLQLHHQD